MPSRRAASARFPLNFSQRLRDHAALEIFHSNRKIRADAASVGFVRDGRRQKAEIRRCDNIAAAHDRDALHGISQLANISRPCMVDELTCRVFR